MPLEPGIEEEGHWEVVGEGETDYDELCVLPGWQQQVCGILDQSF